MKSDRAISELRKSNLYYLLALIISVIGTQFLLYFGYGEPFIAGQSIAIAFSFMMLPVVLLLWLIAPFQDLKFTKFRVAILLFLGLWALSIVRVFIDEDSVNYTFLITPIFLLALFIKPPSQEEAKRLALITASLFVVTIILAQILDMINVRPFREFIPLRWFPDVFSGYRWEGIFGDPNNAGFIAAFLFVYGLSIKTRWKWSLVIIGALVLGLSESRSAILAALIGSLTLLLLRTNIRFASRAKWFLYGILITAVVISLLTVIALDPSLNGRVPIWSAVIDLWSTNYIFGIGSNGLENGAISGDIPWGNSDGHSIIIDTLVRLGIIPFFVVTSLVVISVLMCWEIRRIDKGQSFSVLITFLIGALTYTVVGWSYFGVQMIPWLIALILANGASTRIRQSLDSGRQTKN